MSLALIDYGCHRFTYRLCAQLRQVGWQITYIANSSVESPNLTSLLTWMEATPGLVLPIACDQPYGKMGLRERLRGEMEWGRRCVAALDRLRPSSIVVSCVPLTAVTAINHWARTHHVSFIYWLQDIQSRAIYELLGRKLGMPGRTLGAFAHLWEQELLENSDFVITIADGHEQELPPLIRQTGRHKLLENWANIEDFVQYSPDNDWSVARNLHTTTNVIYSGTLAMKHDLATFFALAERFHGRPEVRIVVVSSGQAADQVRAGAASKGLANLIVLPFQLYTDVPKVLASASVLVAPLEAAAGAFCVPSKVLSYMCAGRPTVIAINDTNSAAKMIRNASAGVVVPPGDLAAFATAVENLLDDPTRRLAMGRSARAYAESVFSSDQIVSRFVSVLQGANAAVAPSLQEPTSTFRFA